MVGPLSLWFLVNNSTQSSILLLYLFWRHDTRSGPAVNIVRVERHNPGGTGTVERAAVLKVRRSTEPVHDRRRHKSSIFSLVCKAIQASHLGGGETGLKSSRGVVLNGRSES
jgi:hypothetical protein